MVSNKASSCLKCGAPPVNIKSCCQSANTGKQNDKLNINSLEDKGTNRVPFIRSNFFKYIVLIVVLVVGFIDVIGKEVISCKYMPDNTCFSDSLTVVRKDGKIGFVDKDGNDTF